VDESQTTRMTIRFESQRGSREDFGVSGLPSYASIYPSSFLLVLAESFEKTFRLVATPMLASETPKSLGSM